MKFLTYFRVHLHTCNITQKHQHMSACAQTHTHLACSAVMHWLRSWGKYQIEFKQHLQTSMSAFAFDIHESKATRSVNRTSDEPYSKIIFLLFSLFLHISTFLSNTFYPSMFLCFEIKRILELWSGCFAGKLSFCSFAFGSFHFPSSRNIPHQLTFDPCHVPQCLTPLVVYVGHMQMNEWVAFAQQPTSKKAEWNSQSAAVADWSLLLYCCVVNQGYLHCAICPLPGAIAGARENKQTFSCIAFATNPPRISQLTSIQHLICNFVKGCLLLFIAMQKPTYFCWGDKWQSLQLSVSD